MMRPSPLGEAARLFATSANVAGRLERSTGLVAEVTGKPAQTYSIGFDAAGDREGDEFAFSDLVAHEFETDHHQFRVGADRLVGALPRAIAARAAGPGQSVGSGRTAECGLIAVPRG